MANEYRVLIDFDNIVPHAGQQYSQKILSVWKAAAKDLANIEYQCIEPASNDIQTVLISLDVQGVITLLESAIEKCNDFNTYRQLHLGNGVTQVNSALIFSINTVSTPITLEGAYHLVSTFLQQFYLAMNLACPGSCQLLGPKFSGPASHQYEAQAFDSKIFFDARMSAQQQGWPKLKSLELTTTWEWINRQNFSRTDIAITDSQKALINLLKMAQQRYRYGSRSTLLAAQQIMILLDMSHLQDLDRLRKRTSMILGDIPEQADCFIELYRLREDFFNGDHPVRRPALICNNSLAENRELISSHNTTVELAAAIIVALIQRLIISEKDQFKFQENLI